MGSNTQMLGCDNEQICPSSSLQKVDLKLTEDTGQVIKIYVLKDHDKNGVGSLILATNKSHFYIVNNQGIKLEKDYDRAFSTYNLANSVSATPIEKHNGKYFNASSAPTELDPLNVFNRGEKILLDKMASVINSNEINTCDQLRQSAANAAEDVLTTEQDALKAELTEDAFMSQYLAQLSYDEMKKCFDTDYYLNGFYGLENRFGLLALGGTFSNFDQSEDEEERGFIMKRLPMNEQNLDNKARGGIRIGQTQEQIDEQKCPNLNENNGCSSGRRFVTEGTFNTSSSLDFARIYEIQAKYGTVKNVRETDYIAGLTFKMNLGSFGIAHSLASPYHTMQILGGAEGSSSPAIYGIQDMELNNSPESAFGLCRIEYIPMAHDLENVRRCSSGSHQTGCRYGSRDVPMNFSANKGAIHSIRFYFAKKNGQVWDNSDIRVATIKAPNSDDNFNNAAERNWLPAFPVGADNKPVSLAGNGCSDMDGREVTGFRIQTAQYWEIESTHPDRRAGSAKLKFAPVMSSMEILYGERADIYQPSYSPGW